MGLGGAPLRAWIRGLNPALTAPDVRQLIIESAEDIAVPGFDFESGHGRINAFNGVTLASTSDGFVRHLADPVRCGGTIDARRLEALPTSTTCVACAA